MNDSASWPVVASTIISMIGKGKSFFEQTLLRSWNLRKHVFVHISLRTMTMLEIHLWYCTSRMKPVSISLSISASICGMSSN